MKKLNDLKKKLSNLADPKQAEILQRFFKTGPGEYGEGDKFLGIKVPLQRKVAREYIDLDLADLEVLLNSQIHEHRMTALIILVTKYRREGNTEKQKYYRFYIKNAKQVNNWDLVDVTAPQIVGNFLLDKPRDILYKLARSNNLWERRIAIVSTFMFIRQKNFKDTIKISEILLRDKHDLIHKAVGWMLREVGKRDQSELTKFLNKYATRMPRMSLRYAIERLDEKKRKYYLYM